MYYLQRINLNRRRRSLATRQLGKYLMNMFSFVAGRGAARWVSARILVAACLVGASAIGSSITTAQTVPLNDTGIIICYGPNVPCDPVQHKKQDAMVGRDAAARTAGSGLTTTTGKGFSFTKLSHLSGTPLPDSAVLGTNTGDWACTRDNVTGLIWEVKTTSSTNFRYFGNSYTWYNPDPSKNGGNAGVANGGACSNAGRCDTQKYIDDLNATNLCGQSNWRLPLPKEGISIVDYGAQTRPSVMGVFFPNLVQNTWYWSPLTYASDSNLAWGVNFTNGTANVPGKSDGSYRILAVTRP